MRTLHMISLILAALMALSACGMSTQDASKPEPASPPASIPIASDPGGDVSAPSRPNEGPAASPGYIDEAALATIAKFVEPGMTEYQKAKAAFDYIITTTYFDEPVGLDLWRIRGSYVQPPSFVENRSLSILLFNVGRCEDYAAALTMLLRGMGMEAEYVPGLTYSAAGTGLVDHAWTMAKIDGVWYHLDSQLEANISKRGTIRYRYFMRGDSMAASHRWGQNLIATGLLTSEQNAELARDFIAEACPQDYPTPAPLSFTPATRPDRAAIEAAITGEFAAYEATYGPMEPVTLNIVPPVFGYEGYGIDQ